MKNKKKPNVNDPAASPGFYPMIARGGSTPTSEGGILIQGNARFLDNRTLAFPSTYDDRFATDYLVGAETFGAEYPIEEGDRVFFGDKWIGTVIVYSGMWVVQAEGPPVRTADWPAGASVSGWAFKIEGDTPVLKRTHQVTNEPGSDIVGTDPLSLQVIS